MAKPRDLVQGTGDVVILGTLAGEPLDGWGIAEAHPSSSAQGHPSGQPGRPHPALLRFEQQAWIRAKYYSLTPEGAT